MSRSRSMLLIVALLASAPALGQFEFKPGKGLDFGGGFGGFPAEPQGDLVTLSAQFTAPTDTAPAMLAVTAKIADGHHVFSITQPRGGPQRTSLRLNEATGVRLLGDWVASPEPKTHIDEVVWQGLSIEEHYGEVTWRAPIELPEGADPATFTINGFANMQACTEVACNNIDDAEFTAELAPAGSIEPIATASTDAQTTDPAEGPGASLPSEATTDPGVTAPPAAAPTATVASLLPIIGAALLGGLILNLMPCVLPVIGLKVLSFAEQAGHHRGKVLAMNLAYVAGLMTVFLLLAGFTASASLAWGEQNTFPAYRIGMVILLFAMSLSFLGVWEIPLPGFAGGKGANELQQQEGFSGAFFKGVFTTILAIPCSGPMLGPVIGYTLSQPTWVTFVIFGSIGIGMAAPYLLIGAFPSLVKLLPKPGAWMETFKQLMGFVLMGTVVFFFSLISEERRLPILATLVGVGFACWWVGRTPVTAGFTQRATAWLGGIGTAVAIWFVTAAMLAPSDHELPWLDFSPAQLAAAHADGKTVLVDFTADWCPTCHVNSRVAINTERVKQVVESNNITPLLADWSDKNDEIEQTLASLGSRSIPFLAIFPADRPDQPILLPDLITEDQLLEALAEAGAVNGNEAAVAMPEIEIGEIVSETSLR